MPLQGQSGTSKKRLSHLLPDAPGSHGPIPNPCPTAHKIAPLYTAGLSNTFDLCPSDLPVIFNDHNFWDIFTDPTDAHPSELLSDCPLSEIARGAMVNPPPLAQAQTPIDHTNWVQIYQAVRASGVPNFRGARLPLVHQLNISTWRRYHALGYFHDAQLPDLLEFEFPLNYERAFMPRPVLFNHNSAHHFPMHVDHYIDSELAYNALCGPFHAPPVWPFQTNAIMTCPKKNSDKRRVILDLSFPDNESVNAGIPQDTYLGVPYKLHLPCAHDLRRLIVQHGQGCHLWSMDLQRSYRQLRICPLDWPLLGIRWRDALYFDTAVPFGVRFGAMYLQRTTEAVTQISWFYWCLVLYRRHSGSSASAFFSVRQNAGNCTIAGVGFIRTGGKGDQSWHPNDLDKRSFRYGADGDVRSCGQNTGMPAFDSGLVYKNPLYQISLEKISRQVISHCTVLPHAPSLHQQNARMFAGSPRAGRHAPRPFIHGRYSLDIVLPACLQRYPNDSLQPYPHHPSSGRQLPYGMRRPFWLLSLSLRVLRFYHYTEPYHLWPRNAQYLNSHQTVGTPVRRSYRPCTVWQCCCNICAVYRKRTGLIPSIMCTRDLAIYRPVQVRDTPGTLAWCRQWLSRQTQPMSSQCVLSRPGPEFVRN